MAPWLPWRPELPERGGMCGRLSFESELARLDFAKAQGQGGLPPEHQSTPRIPDAADGPARDGRPARHPTTQKHCRRRP